MIRLVGLYREKEYSPGRHQSNDTLLLEAVAGRLRASGCHVELTTIDRTERPPKALIFSMCQGRAALDRLLEWERAGAQIVNSPRAALNTYRDRLPALLASAGVPFPQTELISTNGHGPMRGADRIARDRSVPPTLVSTRAPASDGGFWLKRGDVHASVSRDVQWIDSLEAFETGCAEFRSRGIATAAVQAHRAGDEIKFYGVAGGAFFHWFYSGASREQPFDRSALPRLAAEAAHAAGLDVFGGDVIVSPSGELTLIDLNDWPSFAPCRETAADAIANHLTRRAHAAWNRGLVPSANQSAL